MADKVNIGIASILVGECGADKSRATAMSALGLTKEGTGKINFADPSETEFPVEELDTPIYISRKDGKITFNFTVVNPDLNTFVKVFGGKVEGDTYKAPSKLGTKYWTVQFVPEKGIGFTFPYASITAKPTADMGRANLMGIEITGTALDNGTDSRFESKTY